MDDAARGVAGTPDENARTREIRNEIAQTREEMSETIEAIQERLSPSYIAAKATETVKHAASRKVYQMANTAGDAADQVLDSSFIQTVRSNPIPAALIGIGTAWLLMKRRSDSKRSYSSFYRSNGGRDWRNPGGGPTDYGSGYPSAGTTGTAPGDDSGRASAENSGGEYQSADYQRRGYEADGYRDSGSGRSESTARGFGGTSSRSSYGMSQQSFERVIRDNPLALGAAAVLVGAAIGMSIPSTDAENEFMGEARDSVVDRAREMAGEAADKVGEVATQAKDMASRAVDAATANTGGSTPSANPSGTNTSGSSAGSTRSTNAWPDAGSAGSAGAGRPSTSGVSRS